MGGYYNYVYLDLNIYITCLISEWAMICSVNPIFSFERESMPTPLRATIGYGVTT